MKILLTGFEPFGGESVNPALESTKRLHGTSISGAEIISAELPVSWEQVLPKLIEAINEHQPDVVISVGQAGGRAKVTPEYIGINLANGKDNYEVQKNEDTVVDGGPDGYFATLPVKKMIAVMNEAGIPAAPSYSAGTYLCNWVLYATRHYIETQGLNIRSGFIHIPYLPDQVISKPTTVASMSLDMITEGLKQCIEAIVADQE